MGKLRDIIRHNKLYTVMLIFVLGINCLAFLGWMVERKENQEAQSELLEESGEEAVEETAVPEKKSLFDEEDITARQQRLEKLAADNPALFLFLGLFNLLIMFVIFVGIMMDAYFVIRCIRRKPLSIRAIDPDNPGWSIGDVVRVTLIFMSCSYIFMIVQGSLVGIFPIIRNENFQMVFNTAIMNIAGIGVILYFVRKKYAQNVNTIGLTAKRFPENVFYAMAGYVALIPVLMVIMVITFFITKWLHYKPPVQPIVELFIKEKETSILWFSTMFAAVFGPVAEEIFFRGFMYPAVKKKIGIFWAMICISAIFAFLHAHLVGFLPIMALGMLLVYLYEKTGSLVPSITVHIMHNVAMVVLVFIARFAG